MASIAANASSIVGEATHALRVRQICSQASVPDDHELPARQVAHAPVADPRILKLHTGQFNAAELAARRADVAPIVLGAARDVGGRPDPPAACFQICPIRRMSLVVDTTVEPRLLPQTGFLGIVGILDSKA